MLASRRRRRQERLGCLPIHARFTHRLVRVRPFAHGSPTSASQRPHPGRIAPMQGRRGANAGPDQRTTATPPQVPPPLFRRPVCQAGRARDAGAGSAQSPTGRKSAGRRSLLPCEAEGDGVASSGASLSANLSPCATRICRLRKPVEAKKRLQRGHCAVLPVGSEAALIIT